MQSYLKIINNHFTAANCKSIFDLNIFCAYKIIAACLVSMNGNLFWLYEYKCSFLTLAGHTMTFHTYNDYEQSSQCSAQCGQYDHLHFSFLHALMCF